MFVLKAAGSICRGVVNGFDSLFGGDNELGDTDFYPDITCNLQHLQSLQGEERQTRLKEIEGQLAAARQELNGAYEDQVKGMYSADAQAQRKTLEVKEKQLTMLQDWFEQEYLGLGTGAGSPKGLRTSNSFKEQKKDTQTGQKDSLLSSSQSSNDCLKASKRTLNESQQTGMASLEGLQRQRESMQRSKNTLAGTNNSMAQYGEQQEWNAKQKNKLLGLF